MACPLCQQRKPRRQCPALKQSICSVCCGTKRLSEIACPSDCVYLSASREHPAAVVLRQQAHDLALVVPTMQHLTERQRQLFFVFHSIIAAHRPEGFGRLLDDDVAEAAAAVAATLETAARGVIYQHVPNLLSAQRLATELTAALTEVRAAGTTIFDREAAIALRAIEKGARETRNRTDNSDVAYLTAMRRLLPPRPDGESAAAGPEVSKTPTSLIIP